MALTLSKVINYKSRAHIYEIGYWVVFLDLKNLRAMHSISTSGYNVEVFANFLPHICIYFTPLSTNKKVYVPGGMRKYLIAAPGVK